MPPIEDFKLNRKTALAALISTLLPASAMGAAGRIEFAYGDVKAQTPDGQERVLAKGSAINSGETIKTTRGRAHIRFSDGAYMSLQPNTEFKLDEYKFEGKTDGNERGFFSLVKGGFRTITGLIGRFNRKAYQVRTPVATIGIRGTGHWTRYDPDQALLEGGTWQGETTIVGPDGFEYSVAAGYSWHVEEGKLKIYKQGELVLEVPVDELIPGAVTTTDALEALGLDIPAGATDLTSCATGAECVVAYSDGGEAQAPGLPRLGVLNTTSASYQGPPDGGAVTSYQGPSGSGLIGTASLVQSGSDSALNAGGAALIGWSRWNEGITGGSSPHPLDLREGDGDIYKSAHQIIGVPTPVSSLQALTGMWNYSKIGNTMPTSADGFEGGTLNSASLGVDFDNYQGTVSLSVTMTGGSNFAVSNGAFGFAGPSNTFSASDLPTTGSCSGACSTDITGFFAGDQAQRAGLAYEIDRSNAFNSTSPVNGTVAFEKTGTRTPPMN